MIVRNDTDGSQIEGLGENVAISSDGTKVATTRFGFSQNYGENVYVFGFQDGIWQQEFEYRWDFDTLEESSTAMAFSPSPPYSLVISIGGDVTFFY